MKSRAYFYSAFFIVYGLSNNHSQLVLLYTIKQLILEII